MNVSSLRGRLTISISEYGLLLGRGRSAAYEDIRRGDVPSLRRGGSLFVPVPALLRSLGYSDSMIENLMQTDRDDLPVPLEEAKRSPGQKDDGVISGTAT